MDLGSRFLVLALVFPLCCSNHYLCSKPRTLKQMCRVVVYNAVKQRPATTVAKLPLPPSLKDYLLNFEP